MHFLRISAHIPKSKFKELEQSIGLLNIKSNPMCTEFKLLQQFDEHENVQLFTLWNTNADLNFFMHDESFKFLKGTFKTLGVLKDISHGFYQMQVSEDTGSN